MNKEMKIHFLGSFMIVDPSSLEWGEKDLVGTRWLSVIEKMVIPQGEDIVHGSQSQH